MVTPVTLSPLVGMTVASAPGTGTTIALGIALPGGYMTFTAGGAVNGGAYFYNIIDGSNRELAWGIYTSSGTTLTRNTLQASVNGAQQSTPINASANAVVVSASIASSTAGGTINKFRNGTMDVWQRGTSAAADGWIVSGGSSVAQAIGRGPTANSLQVTGSGGDVTVKQRIESTLAAPLTGQMVVVQAEIYNNTGAAITPTLTVKHASSADNWATPVIDINAVSLQSCANAAWTQVYYFFTDTGSAQNGLEITFDFGTIASGTVKITECDIRIAASNVGVPLPELRPLSSEFQLCQRYYQTTVPNGVGQSGSTAAGVVAVSPNAVNVNFPAQMRAAPTLSYWDSAGNSSKVSILTPSVAAPSSLLAASQTSSANSHTFTGAGSIQLDDLVVVAVAYENNTHSVSTITDGVNTYTQAIRPGGTSLELWYCANCQAVASPSFVVTFSAFTNDSCAVLISRQPGMTVVDKTNGSIGSSTSSGTLSTSPEYIYGFAHGNSSTVPSDSNFTSIVSGVDSGGTNQMNLEYKMVTSTSSVTFAPSNDSGVALATFEEAAAGSFTNNIADSGSLSANTSASGFISGLYQASQTVYFHYAATAEL